MAKSLQPSSRRGTLVERRWEPRMDALGGGRARQGVSFQAYVPTPIADERFILDSEIAAAAANAETACRELDGTPQRVGSFEALARQLLRAESVASSRVEGLVLSHRRLAKAAFAPGTHDVTAESVLANIRALERAVDLASGASELAAEDLVAVHRELFLGTRDERLGGVVRTEQNWIGGAAASPRGAEFVPPPAERVPALLEDLLRFCNRDDLPAVIQAAIAHVQFETIHPFHDGNGRVGRAITLIVLRRRGVSRTFLPPVSLVLAGDAGSYVKGLTSWRNGDEADWVGVLTDAVHRAARGAERFTDDVAALQNAWVERAGRPRADSGARRLIELLPSHPVIDVRSAAALLGGTEERARLAVLRLEGAGVLRRTTVGRGGRVWETVGLFDLLDRFERDLGPEGRSPRPTR